MKQEIKERVERIRKGEVPEGYQKTTVGIIPEDWEMKKLGDAAEVVMGQSPVGTSYNHSGTGAPLINGPTEFTEKNPIKIQWTSQPTKFCKKGDVLLCVRGSSTGRMNISDDEYCIGRGVAAIRAKSGVDTLFITFEVESAVKSILILTTGSTFPNIDRKSIKTIQFPLPPLSDQQKIAEILSTWDKAIELKEKLIEEKKEFKRGLMQKLLAGDIRFCEFND
ncbi:MAG: restriction endonuclease subunit S [Patescibacteria group bacterium]|nr:restriction endonuclease subunit S [Patescibacteria group bacterium]